MIPYSLARCPACGVELEFEDERPWEEGLGPRRDWASHRGGLVLTLGIISIVVAPTAFCCSIFGVILQVGGVALGITAWVIGRRDLNRMNVHEMDPSGHGTTQAGYICGIIGTIMNAAAALVLILFVGGMLFFTMRSVTMPPPAPVVAPVTAPAQGGPREQLPPPAEERIED
jgi:hypothetical protein